MGRETINIDSFSKGIVCNADAKDIPLDSARYSLDVDNRAPQGVLQGRPEEVITTLPTATRSYGIINKDATQDIVFHDQTLDYANTAETIAYATAFPSSTTQTTLLKVPVGTKSTMAVHNQEVYIGLGREVERKPKWAGYVTHRRFGGLVANEIQVADSELVIPQSVPFLHKVLADATYLYGFEFDQGTLYKINRSTGAVTPSDAGVFQRIRAICDEDATYLWIYDYGLGSNGTIYKVNKSTFVIATTIALGSFSLNAGAYITDMIGTTLTLWLGAFAETTSPPGLGITAAIPLDQKCLWRIAKNASTNTAPTDSSPRLKQQSGTTAGEWVTALVGGTYTASSAVVAQGAKRNLVVLDAATEKVGYYARIYLRTGRSLYLTSPQYKNNSGTSTLVSNALFVVDNTQVANAPSSVISVDPTVQQGGYDGFVWDGSGGAGSMILYATKGKTVYKKTGLSLPTVTGQVIDANLASATNRTTIASTYYTALSSLATSLFLCRLDRQTNDSADVNKSGVDSVNTSLTTVTAEIDGGLLSLTSTDDTSITSWHNTRRRYYRASILYDGYQHSPLSFILKQDTSATIYGKTLTLTLSDITQLNIRASAIAVFRADGATGSTTPEGFYRQVIQLDFSDPRWVFTGNAAVITVNDSAEDGGTPYETVTGMPETLPSSMVNYELSAVVNNHLFVANCGKAEIPDASHFLFRSKPARYSMFDWSNDFLRLPFTPTAISGFRGRLYVFGVNQIAVVNPEGLFIEDLQVGAGADNARCVTATEYGMFFCNRDNIFVHDGKQVMPIGLPILRSYDTAFKGWQEVAHTYFSPILMYIARLQTLLVLHSDATIPKAFVYHLPTNRWDKWTFNASFAGGNASQRDQMGIIVDKDGVGYLAMRAGLFAVAAASTRTAVWSWASQIFDMDDGPQSKKFYKVKATVSGSDATTFLNFSVVTDNGTDTGVDGVSTIAAGNRKTKTAKLLIESNGFTTAFPKVENIGLVCRPLIGKR